MPLQTQRFEGTVATSLTTGNSGFNLVNPSGDSRFTYQNPPSPEIYGGTVGRIIAGAGEVNEGRFASGDTTAAAAQIIVYFTGHCTGAVCDIVTLRGTIQNSTIRYRNDNTITLLNSGSNDNLERRFTPPLNTWLVIDVRVAQGTTTTDGTNAYRVRRLDDLNGTPLVDFAATDVNTGQTGTHVINSYRVGKITSATAVIPEFYLAAFDVEDGRTSFLPDPVASASAPVPVKSQSAVQSIDWSASSDAISLTVDSVSGGGLTVEDMSVDGLVLSFMDTPARDTPVTINVTVVGPGGSTPDSITVSAGVGATVIRRIGELIMIDDELR